MILPVSGNVKKNKDISQDFADRKKEIETGRRGLAF
jgi:hypothetical protein